MEHRPKHKSACSGVRRAREAAESAKQALINHPDFRDDNPFVHHVGRFWEIVETRPYMMGLSKLINAIQQIVHHDAVQVELDYCMEMLRLCPGDNMGVRGSVPGNMLRLNKDQECYDFLKWWETTANDRNYDWDDHSRYLNIKNADVFESVDFLSDKNHGEISHPICLMILKIKLVIDLLRLQSIEGITKAKLAETIPDIHDAPPAVLRAFKKGLRAQKVASPTVLARDDLMNGKGIPAKIEAVKKQIDRLYTVIDNMNKHVWPAVMEVGRDPDLFSGPHMFMMGSKEEMKGAINQTWDVWAEIPGALEFIKFKIAGKEDELFQIVVNN